MMEKRHITDHVKELTPYFEKALDGLVAKYDFMTGRRGMGLMQGIVIDARIPVGSIVTKALEAGSVMEMRSWIFSGRKKVLWGRM